MRPSSVVDGDGYDFEEVLRQLAKGGPVPRDLLRPMAEWAVRQIDGLPEVQCPECDTTIRAPMA
jgi:hypothetical protein